jgi:Baseplate J-like protein
MAVQFRCTSDKRRQILRDPRIPVNGIDYLEVVHQDAPEGTPPQRTLLVRMLKADPWGLSAANVRIHGGVRVTDIDVVWTLKASEASEALDQGRITEAEQDFFLALPASNQVLVVRTDTEGDFSPYTLQLVTSSTDTQPPDGFDPILSAVEFSFKVDCPSEFDCQVDDKCPPEVATEPLIDYLAKDYASLRRLMLDRLAVVVPAWRERSPADLGIAIVEVLAYAADYLSFYQDAVATEAYLGTARRRVSMRRHARLLDYPMHDGCNARTWVHVEVDTDSIMLNKGTQLVPRVSGLARRIPPDSTAYDQAFGQQPVVFETMHHAMFYQAHNQLAFYTWGEPECCLPKGATHATLKADLFNLQVGDALVFEEVRGAESGRRVDADPEHRHVVRLTKVTPMQDPLGGQFLDPPTTDPVLVTEIEWMDGDALPFPLCVSMVEVPEDDRGPGDPEAQPVSVVLGNMVLADHGRSIVDEELDPVPATGRYRPRLQRFDVTQRCVDDEDENSELSSSRSAIQLVTQDPHQALPAVILHNGDEWYPQRDLLASDRFAAEFVVEMENDGRAYLRFGDGIYGRQPTTNTEFTATYRIGNGQSGNIGAEAIYHVVTNDTGITSIRNPLPAQGGTDPEAIEDVRLYAPRAFRTQERAVTEADYAEVAERHSDVQEAAATRRWTGSWYTMFLTVDRKGGRPVDADFEAELRDFLERYRLAGQDLEIDGPSFVPLDIAFTVCVEPGYFRSDVKEALLETFSNRDLPDGRRGFFHPDNFTFGQPVYLSPIVAAIMQVPGVRWVDLAASKGTRFKRWGQGAHGELKNGQIDIGRLEIARLDNDPNTPENGKIDFIMEGGL